MDEVMKRTYADLADGSFSSLGFGHLPFRQAVRHGDVVYVTGQVAVEETPSRMPQQTRIAMANMKDVLAQVGATMADVVKTTSYYVGRDGLEESAAIQAQQFPSAIASTSVVVAALGQPSVTNPPGAAPLGPRPPSCHAVRCGNTIYVSGLVAADQQGGVVYPGDMPRQAAVTMDRMRSVLGQLGATLDDVVHTNVYFVGSD